MESPFHGLIIFVPILVATVAYKLLKHRRPWLRTAISAASALGTGFALSYYGSYINGSNPAMLEAELTALAPSIIPLIKDEDPDEFQAFVNSLAQKVKTNPGYKDISRHHPILQN
jgi:hypothetical protein